MTKIKLQYDDYILLTTKQWFLITISTLIVSILTSPAINLVSSAWQLIGALMFGASKAFATIGILGFVYNKLVK